MEDKMFDLLTKMYSEMQDMKTDMKDMKTEIKDMKTVVTRIEYDHGRKLEALFDGYKQHTDQLDRIEKEVARQEEVIIRRIK